MSAAERLLTLSGASSGTASALLLSIGSGATAGETLTDYSQLESAEASAHLLTNRLIASLGAAPHKQKARTKKSDLDLAEQVLEPIGFEAVSRLRNEFLSSALAGDLIARARVRKSRAEEEALLLMI